MEELEAYRADLLFALGNVIEALSLTVSSLPPDSWNKPSQAASRTRHYWLFHLRALETQVFIPNLPRFLDDSHPILPIFDEAAWMAVHYRPQEPVSAILENLRELRHQELEWLRNLAVEDWSWVARHPWWGEHTLQWWVELQLDVSHQHLMQLSPLTTS